MRIENLRQEQRGDRRRLAADVHWEDGDRPQRTLYFEAGPPFAEELEMSAEAFLLGTFAAALWYGERRIRIEGTLCPRLCEGLESAMAIFAMWHPRCRPLALEPTRGFVPTLPRPQAGTAAFMSGGVDALALLRANRLDYPLDHPASIRTCLLLFGLNSHDFDASGPRPERLAAFEAYLQRMQRFAEQARLTLVPLHTNTRALFDDFETWAVMGLGAGTICTAFLLPRRIRDVWLASEGAGVERPPRGTHPLLDHHFSTAAVAAHHGQAAMTRLEKLRLIADWEAAHPVLRSCFYLEVPPAGQVNCGTCEKCVRTMLALLALDRLGQVSSFPGNDLSPAQLEVVHIRDCGKLVHYSECIAPLEERNRHDLTALVRREVAAYHRWERREWLRRLKERVLTGWSGGRVG